MNKQKLTEDIFRVLEVPTTKFNTHRLHSVIDRYLIEFSQEFCYSTEYMYRSHDNKFANHQIEQFFTVLARQILENGYYSCTQNDSDEFKRNRYSITVLKPDNLIKQESQ